MQNWAYDIFLTIKMFYNGTNRDFVFEMVDDFF